MAIMLLKNDGSKTPVTHPGLRANELVECAVRGCPIDYTIAYGQVEVHRPDSAIELARRKGVELISSCHPHPLGRHEFYMWTENERRWFDEGVR
jgi:hypothetical protein